MTAETTPISEHDFHAYAFAKLCQLPDLSRISLVRLLEGAVASTDLGNWARAMPFHLPDDDQEKLVSVLGGQVEDL